MSRPLASFSLLALYYERDKQQQQQQQQQQEAKKIKIKPKTTCTHTQVGCPAVAEKEKQEVQKKKITIIIKRKKCKYNDIAPPASLFYNQKNEFYSTPPPQCLNFYIGNKKCFLRQRDNACISPVSKNVIGFWNEKVGKECKLLPIENETTYEENIDKVLQQELASQPTSQNKNNLCVSKQKFVSDAQRARIASEPVALLREKLAKQYGMIKKN